MRGRGGRSGSSGNNDMSGLIAGGIGYLGGSTATSGGETSIGDGMKYGIKCDINNDSQYCKDVKNYNRFQMMVSIISTIIGAILFLVGLYFLYKMYLSK
jgi:hypothetical protein|tara:strand:+ start:436 stop:732 length:297 start_codon:yes stop_codon:yes gene_type:complete